MEMTGDTSETRAGLDKLSAELELAIKYATDQVGMAAAGEMKKQITGGHKKGTPTPSPVGSPPTNVTGNLRRSIRSSKPQKGFGNEYTVTVGAYMIYARQLELGGGKWPNGVRYPFVAPTAKIMQESGRARSIYENALRAVLGK